MTATLGEYSLIIISSMLVSNVVFARFLGICPYLGVSKSLAPALGMSGAVLFVMAVATAVAWPLQHFVLVPWGLDYLQTIVFILVIASLVQLVEMVMRKTSPVLFRALGIYLPLITTNCAILGVAILCIQEQYNYPQAMVFAVGSAIGFGVALLIFAGLREFIEESEVPPALRGAPIALITAGILALAFMGFSGLVK